MNDSIPAFAIAQALQQWRDAIPESGFRGEVLMQVMARARLIVVRSACDAIECGGCAPPVIAPFAIDPLAVLRGDQYATLQDVCRAWAAERDGRRDGMEHAP